MNHAGRLEEWDRPRLERFRAAYAKGVAQAGHPTVADEFDFEGQIYLLPYAKYLIEYLDRRLGPVVTTGEEKRDAN